MARNKKPATTGDMIRTLAVILVPLVLITWFFSRDLGDYQVQTVDWKPTLAQARSESPYPVLAPEGLPDTWRATQVAWVPLGRPHLNGEASVRNLWQLGFLNPDDIFVSVNQGDAQPDRFVADLTREGYPDGQSMVGDQTWVRFVSLDERTRSLVLSSPSGEGEAPVTTVVVGDTTYASLEAFAGSLSAG